MTGSGYQTIVADPPWDCRLATARTKSSALRIVDRERRKLESENDKHAHINRMRSAYQELGYE